MAYNEQLADSIRKFVAKQRGIEEKAMFGGLSFLLNGRMFCGVLKDDLVARVDPADGEKLLGRQNVRPMDFTGRPMKGFLLVDPSATRSDKDLSAWIHRTLEFVSGLPEKKKPTKDPSAKRKT